jgi:hypothetical protein
LPDYAKKLGFTETASKGNRDMVIALANKASPRPSPRERENEEEVFYWKAREWNIKKP